MEKSSDKIKLISGWLLVLMLFVLLIIGGCTKHSKTVILENVDITAHNDANGKFATALDLVIVFDKELAGTLGSMPANEYFKKAEQIKRDNAENVLVWHWEVIPGQSIYKTKIEYNKYHPLVGFFFARYYSKGEHRIRINKVYSVKVILADDKFIVQPMKNRQ